MFGKILIANRGEIACRVIHTARRMGIATVAVYSDADRDALHVRQADAAVHIGPAPASGSYLATDRILDAVRQTGADAVHPGYGFLSENAAFAEALAGAGVTFIGPPAGAIRVMGDKIAAKRLAAGAGVATVPGHPGPLADAAAAQQAAAEIGFPVMLKASAGGGGKGMRIARDAAAVATAFRAARHEAAGAFGDDRVFVEKYIDRPRHIEIQVLADRHGQCIHLGERECSIQRRHQKVIEEAPSPFLDAATRRQMGAQAVALARAVDYSSAGTVEFVVDGDRNFYFLEMNTRLQVEHPVTELVTGLDLVEQMIRIAAGERLALAQADIRPGGWAIEARIYAEDPWRGHLPVTGRLTRCRPPAATAGGAGCRLRVDSGVTAGSRISMYYDPMIAKLSARGPDRKAAIAALGAGLDVYELDGIAHNIPFLSAILDSPAFLAGETTTGFIAETFPGPFTGVTPEAADRQRIAAIGLTMHMIALARDASVSGRLPGWPKPPGRDWIVTLDGDDHPFTIESGAGVPATGESGGGDPGAGAPETGESGGDESRPVRDAGHTVLMTSGDARLTVTTDWRPGAGLCRARVNDMAMVLRVAPQREGWRLGWRGATVALVARRPRAAALARLMPVKPPPDRSAFLLCPMPGTVTEIHVQAGDVLEPGAPLATVEAMKMENLLTATAPATVKKLVAKAGDVLAADDVILEFG